MKKKIEELLPKTKFDIELAEQLLNYDKSEIEPYLSELVIWLQDLNWPVSDTVCKILRKFQEELIPHFEKIFSTNDDIWKYWCLRQINTSIKNDVIFKMKSSIERMAYNPTKGEIENEVQLEAKELLEKIKFLK